MNINFVVYGRERILQLSKCVGINWFEPVFSITTPFMCLISIYLPTVFPHSFFFFIVFFAAGFCATADVPAACVCVLSAGAGGSGCRWRAALLQPAPPEPAHHHEVPSSLSACFLDRNFRFRYGNVFYQDHIVIFRHGVL